MAPAANSKSSKASASASPSVQGDSRRRKRSSKAGDQANHPINRKSPRKAANGSDNNPRRPSALNGNASDDTQPIHLNYKHRQTTISTLYELISRTKPSFTICPSQVSRALHSSDKAQFPDWRGLMDPVREVVWEEVRRGRVEVTQGRERRAWEKRQEVKGPIRVRRGPKWEDRGRNGGDDDDDED